MRVGPPQWLAAGVAALGVIAGVWVWRLADAERTLALQVSAQHALAAVAERTQQRLERHADMLRSVSALYAASVHVSRGEFARFHQAAVAGADADYAFAGINFIAAVPAAQLAPHIQQARADGAPDYRVFPPGQRAFYAPITFIEPAVGRNLEALGFDI